METQEAIKWVFDIWHEWENVYVPISAEISLKEGKKMDEVIELLKRGEKFEKNQIALVEEIEKRQRKINELEKYRIMWIENKYYSKTKKDNFTEKVMEKINKEVDHDKTEIS